MLLIKTTQRIAQAQRELDAIGLKRPSKFPCGKLMGKHLYLHHSAAGNYLSRSARAYVTSLVTGKPEAFGVIVKVDISGPRPKAISFTEVPTWNTAHEPTLGSVHKPSPKGWVIEPERESKRVYHHPWQFVDKDYQGFSVQKSMERSLLWKRKAGVPNRKLSSLIGHKKQWLQWLSDNNLPA